MGGGWARRWDGQSWGEAVDHDTLHRYMAERGKQPVAAAPSAPPGAGRRSVLGQDYAPEPDQPADAGDDARSFAGQQDAPTGPPWWKRTRVVLTGGLGALAVAVVVTGLTLAGGGSGDETAESSPPGPETQSAVPPTRAPVVVAPAPESGYVQPVPEPQEGAQGRFWTTAFVLVVPTGGWERLEVDGGGRCGPVAEESYRLQNDRGIRVAASDQAPQLTFDRSRSRIVGDTCEVEVATRGDFDDDLGGSYQVTNDVLQASLTPEQVVQRSERRSPASLPLLPFNGLPSVPSRSASRRVRRRRSPGRRMV